MGRRRRPPGIRARGRSRRGVAPARAPAVGRRGGGRGRRVGQIEPGRQDNQVVKKEDNVPLVNNQKERFFQKDYERFLHRMGGGGRSGRV